MRWSTFYLSGAEGSIELSWTKFRNQKWGEARFTSPEPKAQVSFPEQNLSVVRRRCRCKLFTFSSSSPEPLGQHQPNLAQKNVQMKGPALFPGEIITKLRKYIDEI